MEVPEGAPYVLGSNEMDYSITVTFIACSPLAPFPSSKATFCPSFSVLKESDTMPEKCTKTSLPSSRVIESVAFLAIEPFNLTCHK